MNVFSSRRLILISVNSFSANDPPTINVYKECTQHNNSSVCRRFNWSHEKKIIKSETKWKKNDKNTSKSINQSTKQKRNTLWQGSRKLLLTNYASHFQWPMNRIVQARKKKHNLHNSSQISWVPPSLFFLQCLLWILPCKSYTCSVHCKNTSGIHVACNFELFARSPVPKSINVNFAKS